jgi:endonuclease-3 related protein
MKKTDRKTADTIRKVYDLLLEEYGRQGWWPLIRTKGGEPEYFGGPRNQQERFEVAVGAVLVQNTSWKNAAKALSALSEAEMIDPARLADASHEEVAALVRSSGYYNQKARRLGILARFFLEAGDGPPERESLLALEGVGPETADSILLYAFSRTFFVVDAYTSRLFSRLDLCDEIAKYHVVQDMFMDNLESDTETFNEYHALIVLHCKSRCKTKVPLCDGCSLRDFCRYGSMKV